MASSQELANHGYVHEGYTNFFPLYPLLVRVLHEVTGLHIDLGLILVPNLAALGGLLVLYRLVAFIEDESAAKWTLMLFISFPFAFFQAMAYPESLMVLFTALACTSRCAADTSGRAWRSGSACSRAT